MERPQSAGALDSPCRRVAETPLIPAAIFTISTRASTGQRCTITGGGPASASPFNAPASSHRRGRGACASPIRPASITIRARNKCNVQRWRRKSGRVHRGRKKSSRRCLPHRLQSGRQTSTRDMIEGQPGSGIGQPGRKFAGASSLWPPASNGYPYEYPWDNLALCNGLAKEIASDIRGTPKLPLQATTYHPSTNQLAGESAGWRRISDHSRGWLRPENRSANRRCASPTRRRNGLARRDLPMTGIVCSDSATAQWCCRRALQPAHYGSSPATNYSHSSDSDWMSQFLCLRQETTATVRAFYGGHCDMAWTTSPLWNTGRRIVPDTATCEFHPGQHHGRNKEVFYELAKK